MSILALDLGSKMGFAVHLIVYNQIGRMADKYASLKDLMSDQHLDSSVKSFFKQLEDTDLRLSKEQSR
ncbi:hypothetical protein AP064_03930 [Candidatus Liberibacter solanacearum]|uniref:Uncharacterized protein n=1 Tax=Candidatus Liberibacter solanacearum TaxID=556287 RepID=A0A0F4VLV5_9HYPH|nr:hypothetical protein KP07_01550 [Candidatus Liberibacter solanacearum]KJZ81667.1 hypothetical protein DJ66_0389 [Candidatus Liberibacter solanacearum]KQC48937.1 hypothetical protein AP064_03930 [Candidatus Liberibacter solanacearum]